MKIVIFLEKLYFYVKNFHPIYNKHLCNYVIYNTYCAKCNVLHCNLNCIISLILSLIIDR